MSSTFAAAAPPPYLNGNATVSPEFLREAAFLEKLLQIREQVLAGKHPRIKLPPSVLEQVAPRSTQNTPPIARPPAVNGTPNGKAPIHLLPSRPESSLQSFPAPTTDHNPAHHASRPYSAKSASSGIDPVLLTKSDHLIRAELQLKRQQIERSLKDQFDKRGRGNDALADDRGALDVENILAQAHALVKPISGLPSARNSEGSESFDENSYYSSKANSWSSEEAEHRMQGADGTNSLVQQAQHSAPGLELTAANTSLPTSQTAEHAVIDLDEEPYEPADDIELYEPEPARVNDDQDESDYSPPPADVSPAQPGRARGRDRHRDNNGTNGRNSRRQSPSGNPQPIQNTRKRRREERREEKRRQQANRRVIRSPEPYIKEEPQSPPPFASYPDSQPSKRRALQPLQNVESSSPRAAMPQPIYYREQEQSPRAYRPYEEPLSPTVVRIPQRRDDQDLRRVASLQYARRPYSPGPETYVAPEPRQIRAVSHAFAEAPVERPLEYLHREASLRPTAAPLYVQERSRSPVHEYVPRPQSPGTMAPPPRRIVIDQFGNKYYAAPVEVRESAAPPTRRIEADPYYQRAVTREPTMRAPVRQEIYEEENVQRMPPPPPRRYIEASDAEPLETRQFRQSSHRPLEMEYAPREVIERRPVVQYEEMGPPREYLPSRAYSMRPESIRREPLEYAPTRHESVQPGYVRVAPTPRYRELSVVQEPYDDRRYAFAAPTQGRRYVEEGAAENMVEAPQDAYGVEPRRVSYRY